MSAEFRVGRSVGRTIYQGDDLVGLMDTVELAERAVAAMNRPPQEPRTGGVALVEDFLGDEETGTPCWFKARRDETPTHVAFTVAEAESLIDPRDPAVRGAIADAVLDVWQSGERYVTATNAADAVLAALAALRSKP